MTRRTSPGRPTGKYTQAVRLFNLFHRLENSPDGVRIDDLARELDVTARSVRRDLKALQGAEIELEFPDVHNERRVRLAQTGKTTEPIRMTKFQRYSLTAVRRAFDVLEGTPFHDDLSQLFAKLAQGNAADGAAADPMADRFVYIADAPKSYKKFRDQLYEIYDGVLRSLTLAFYYDGGTSSGQRKLQPYSLVMYRNGLYVVGYDVQREEPRTFAVERMKRVRALPNAHFDRDPEFNVTKMFEGAFGIISGQKPRPRVAIEFGADVGQYIVERTWHPSQKIENNVDGGGIIEFDVHVTQEVVGWVLRWGPSVKVLAPPELVNLVQDQFVRAAALYATSAASVPVTAPRTTSTV